MPYPVSDLPVPTVPYGHRERLADVLLIPLGAAVLEDELRPLVIFPTLFLDGNTLGRVRRELDESGCALACFDSFVEVGPPQAGTADRCRRGRAEKERERGGGDGEASEVCGLLGLERITLIVLRHRGKYAGCLSRSEYRLDAANTAKTPGEQT